jgi:hypothetical protein
MMEVELLACQALEAFYRTVAAAPQILKPLGWQMIQLTKLGRAVSFEDVKARPTGSLFLVHLRDGPK